MKRILIFSDTHDMIENSMSVIEKTGKTDLIIHAGDCVRDAQDLQSIYPDIPIEYVRGNNDWYSNAPADVRLTVAGKRIFITHGHAYNVKYEYTLNTLKKAAGDVDLIVFGHTHKPYLEYGNVNVINPGSITYTNTYALCEIDKDKMYITIKDVRA